MDLPYLAERELDGYIENLLQIHIQLRDREDVLIWDSDPAGRYTSKAGYIMLNAVGNQREMRWW